MLSPSRSLKITGNITDEALQDLCDWFAARIDPLMSDHPVVSVVFPAHNEERYLPVMLDSLSRLQTSIPVEFIGVDNVSTDRTADIIKQSGARYVREEKKGTSYARQVGLLAARGQYVLTTDADTIFPREWIDANMAYFDDPDLVCFSGGSTPQWAHPLYYIARSGLRWFRWAMGATNHATSMMSFPGHNMVFRREAALSIGGYEPGSDLGEDNRIARKMRTQGNILQINSDPHARVITSARRVATVSAVVRMIHDRVTRSWEGYETPGGLTFRDIR